MNVEIVIFVECDFVGIKYMKATSDGPKIASEDIALSIVFVG